VPGEHPTKLSVSTMHKFFHVPELVSELSDEILLADDEKLLLALASNSEDSFEGRGDLARFARVCKTVSAPALDALWRSVDFTIVLTLLPICDMSDAVEFGILVRAQIFIVLSSFSNL
jgi:hypothetical protein